MAVFGALAFLVCVARPAMGAYATPSERRAVHRRLLQFTGWSFAVAIASGIIWFAVQAAAMSGMPLGGVLNRETLGAVFQETLFGRVTQLRLGLAVALGATLLWSRHWPDDRSWRILGVGGGLLAGGFLGTLAWTGHATAEQGVDRCVHSLADVVHLLAAGAWVGALPMLVFLLTRSSQAPSAAALATQVTRRFSMLGLVCVGALVITGIVNTWYTVETVPALFGTHYGLLLLSKLVLFGAMVVLAAINRLYLTPRLVTEANIARSDAPPRALRWLRRNAMTEFAFGLVIVGIVGALGVTIPARHVQPVWPFPYTLDWATSQGSTLALVAGMGLLLGLVLALLGIRIRRWAVSMVGLGAFAATLAALAWSLRVPAYPSTYFQSPVPYAAPAIAHGAALFTEHCAACHGPTAASLPARRPNLPVHALHRREGELFWLLEHGIAGTPMPGFGDRMSERELWETINFLHALGQAQASKTVDDLVEPWRPIVAPDFTFQIDRQPQESLKQQRTSVVLLVIYTLPEAYPRLRALSAAKRDLSDAGLRIIAVPMNDTAASPSADASDIDASILALPDPDLVVTYRMFCRINAEETPRDVTRMEFLIDRVGYLRARWTPDTGRGWDEIPTLLRQVETLNHEQPRPPAIQRHSH